MESPWGPAPGVDSRFDAVAERHHDGLLALRGGPRSSLGMLIERSTSAPPQSSGLEGLSKYHFDAYGGGNDDIMDHISKGRPGLTSASDAAYSNSSQSGGDIDISDILGNGNPHDDSASLSHLVDQFDTFSPFPAARTFGRSASASSESHIFSDRSTSTDVSQKHSFGIRPLDGLVRSQSAAPSTYGGRSSLGPPPGLGLVSSHSDSFAMHMGQQRPASAGSTLRNSSSALRPAAKTLMDLIQEDVPNESYSQDQEDVVQPTEETLNGRTSQSSGQSDDFATFAATPVTSNQYYHETHQQHQQVQNVRTPAYNTHLQAPQQQQVQQRQVYVNDSYQQQPQPQLSSPSLNQLQLQSPVYAGMGNGLQQQEQHLSPEVSVYQQQQQQPPQQLHQHVYLQHAQQQQHSAQMDGQQQPGMYFINGTDPQHQQQALQFNLQQVGSDAHHLPPQQQRQVQMQMQQVITTASGQTVYITAPMSSNQPNYGYAQTQLQYQQNQMGGQPQQQGHIVQNIVGNNDQYVSVVPMQNGAYWQAENPSMTSGGVPTVAIVNRQQVALQRVGGGGGLVDHGQQGQQQYQGRYSAREPKQGGRSAGRGGRSGRRADGKSHPTGSPLLNEFRAMKSRDWTLHHIVGHVVEFASDQNGSRFIQQRLEMRDIGEQQIVMNEILPAIRKLRNDVFGNYVVQKLLDFGTSDVKAAIRDTLKGEMVQLSFQMYGCRVVQKAFEGLSDEDIPGLLAEFTHNVLSCIHDQNGNHVIQKCIEVVCARLKHRRGRDGPITDEHIDFIIRDVLVNATALSCHPYGCRVLQRILEHCDEGRKVLILNEIMKSHRKLLDDQYGNYVIQHVLQFGREVDRDSLLAIIIDSGLLVLARQKFASNVVEKLLKYGNSRQRRAIVREMLKKGDDPTVNSHAIPGDHGSSVVLLMVRDAYANYVVQTTLDVIPESEEKRLFLQELGLYADELRQYTFAKHIVAKLQTMVVE